MLRLFCSASLAFIYVQAGPLPACDWALLVLYFTIAFMFVRLDDKNSYDKIFEWCTRWAIMPVGTTLVVYLFFGFYVWLLWIAFAAYSNWRDYKQFKQSVNDPCGIKGCGCAANRDDDHPWKLVTQACSICITDYRDEIIATGETHIAMSVHCRHVFHAACLRACVSHQGSALVRKGEGHFEVIPGVERPGCPICRRQMWGIYEWTLQGERDPPSPPPRDLPEAWHRDPLTHRLVRQKAESHCRDNCCCG